MSGKIFRFKVEDIKGLKDKIGAHIKADENMLLALQQQPSVYMTLAALTWAHVTRARLETEENASRLNDEGQATLMTPVSWKGRALKGNDHYFGNAISPVFTKASISQLLRACADTKGLTQLIGRISDSVKSVDEEYISHRIALFKKIPDLRRLGLDFDIRNPQEYTFNSWRWFGGGTKWRIPGVKGGKAAAIRRVTTSHKLGAIVILPAETPEADQELYIELPTVSMDRLCKDEEWMRWVDAVIE